MTQAEDHRVRQKAKQSDAMRRIRTSAVRGGHEAERDGVWPLVAPVVTSTVYASHDPDQLAERMDTQLPSYSRDHFPNTRLLEKLVADLEGANAGYAVSSGMAAVSLVALALMSAGDHVVMGSDSYSDAEHLLMSELPRFGMSCSVVDLARLDDVRAAIRPETTMIYAETITNPGMCVADIPGLAEIAHLHDIPLVVDNTFASPALCQPIAHGADLVIHSVTKFLGGHHDLSAGVVVGNRRWMERIQQFGYLLGATLGANDAAMAVRGIRTLAPRMAWISESAMEVAAWLDTRPEVARVRYPGLACGQPGNLAKRMLPDGFGGVVVAEFASDERASRVADFVRELKMVPYAPSLGGEITTVCYPPRLRHHLDANSHEPELRLRFSIGLEHPADLIDDLDQAFAATAG